MEPDKDTFKFSIDELCSRIAVLTGCIMDFWADGGWARDNTARLLSSSQLEWQSSLANSLVRWIDAESDGDLILAWANLGALVEGQLKLFLCVYYDDYQADVNAIQKKGQLVDPDRCTLEQIRHFFVKRIWNAERNWNPYVQMVQSRRNTIHAYQPRELGTFSDWRDALALHLTFVRDTGGGLPYPDEYFSGLREK